MPATNSTFSLIWADDRVGTPPISDSNYRAGWTYLGATPVETGHHDYVMNLQDTKLKWLYDQFQLIPVRQNNLTATTDPSVSDDSDSGYEALSTWINTITGEVFTCISAAVGAADWQNSTLTPDQLGNVSLLNANSVGQNIIQLANPSAISYIRINADNTISALSKTSFLVDLGFAGAISPIGSALSGITSISDISFIRINANNSVTARNAIGFLTDLGLISATPGTGSGVFRGSGNVATGNSAVVIGGTNNLASGDDSVSSGRYSSTRGLLAAKSHAAYPFGTTQGSRQKIEMELMKQTTDATGAFMTARGGGGSATDHYVMPDNCAAYINARVIASDSSGNIASWDVKITAKRGAGAASSALVGTPSITQIHADAGASGWGVGVVADTTYGGVNIRADGAASTTIWWGASLESTELIRA